MKFVTEVGLSYRILVFSEENEIIIIILWYNRDKKNDTGNGTEDKKKTNTRCTRIHQENTIQKLKKKCEKHFHFPHKTTSATPTLSASSVS